MEGKLDDARAAAIRHASQFGLDCVVPADETLYAA
jgi:hypothetical protein